MYISFKTDIYYFQNCSLPDFNVRLSLCMNTIQLHALVDLLLSSYRQMKMGRVKMETTRCSEKLVATNKITRCHNPEDCG
jgi:hypothetical protein